MSNRHIWVKHDVRGPIRCQPFIASKEVDSIQKKKRKNIQHFDRKQWFLVFCSGTEAKAKILAGIGRWESVTCLTFIPKQDISDGQWKELGHRNFLDIVNGRG